MSVKAVHQSPQKPGRHRITALRPCASPNVHLRSATDALHIFAPCSAPVSQELEGGRNGKRNYNTRDHHLTLHNEYGAWAKDIEQLCTGSDTAGGCSQEKLQEGGSHGGHRDGVFDCPKLLSASRFASTLLFAFLFHVRHSLACAFIPSTRPALRRREDVAPHMRCFCTGQTFISRLVLRSRSHTFSLSLQSSAPRLEDFGTSDEGRRVSSSMSCWPKLSSTAHLIGHINTL
jgi:hypothetical protein